MPEPTWVSFPVSAVNIATFQGAYRCDAFYSNDDKYRRVLVVAGRSVYEASYSTKGIGTALLKQFEVSDLIDIAGFYSPTNKSRHAVISLADLSGEAQMIELVSHPTQSGVVSQPSQEMLALRISAFYNLDTHFSHAITLGTNTIYDFVWDLKNKGNNQQLFEVRSFPTLPTIADVAGFYTEDDRAKHAIFGCFDGTLVELYWFTDDEEKQVSAGGVLPTVPNVGEVVLAQLPGRVIAVAAFYIRGNRYSRRVVASTEEGVFEVAYDPHVGVRAAKLLVPEGTVLDVGGFYSEDDKMCHAILLLVDQNNQRIVQEVYYPA